MIKKVFRLSGTLMLKPGTPTINLRQAFTDSSKKGVLANLVEHVKMEMENNKHLKENLEKLKIETERLEQSESLKQARLKFDLVEKETLKSSDRLRQQLLELQKYLGKSLEDAKKTVIGQKGLEVSQNVYSTAREAVSVIEESVELLRKTSAYKTVSQGTKVVNHEFDHFAYTDGWVYKELEILKKRTDELWAASNQVIMENPDVTSLSVHKDDRWYSIFKSWSNSNPYMQKLMNFKAQYEESEMPMIMMARLVSEKISSGVRSLLYNSSISEVTTEICKSDPSFDLATFCDRCQREIIPNVLEASFRREYDVVKDWCGDVAYAQLTHLFTECTTAGYIVNAKLLDVGPCEPIMGKITEIGPLLLLSFSTHQIRQITTPQGDPVFNTSEAPLSIAYVWALCRDREELNPKAAWKIMEVAEFPAKKTV